MYRIKSNPHSEFISYLDRQNTKLIPRFNGKPIGDRWIKNLPVRLAWSEDNDGSELGSHFPFLLDDGILACSGKAWDCLKLLIGEHVEALELDCQDGQFFALNVLTIKECLNYEESQLTYWADGYGGIQSVQRLVFRSGCSDNAPIFKIPEFIMLSIYVSEAFKAVVEANNLKGMIFRQVPEK